MIGDILGQLRQQFVALRSTLLAVLLTVLFMFLVVIAFEWWGNVPIPHLTRDVTAVVDVPGYVGMLSNIGIVFWSATVALCFFGGALLFTMQREHGPRGYGLHRFLYASGAITTLLLIDDLFLIHENMPILFRIPERIVFGLYGVLIVGYLGLFWRQILQTDFLLILLALGAFGFSMGFDLLPVTRILQNESVIYLIEDGAKFIGICCWLAYFVHVSSRAVRMVMENGERRL